MRTAGHVPASGDFGREMKTLCGRILDHSSSLQAAVDGWQRATLGVADAVQVQLLSLTPLAGGPAT